MTYDEKHGPLTEQLAQARQDAADRAAHREPPANVAVGEISTEAAASTVLRVTRREPQWRCEVRGTTVLRTNMLYEPPLPQPVGASSRQRTRRASPWAAGRFR